MAEDVGTGAEEAGTRAVRGGGPSRRGTAQAAARRHSLMVRSLKIVLPIVAIGVASLLGVRALLYRYAPDLKLPTVLFSKDGLTMVEPRLSGRSKDRAYEVVAARAVQSLDDPKKIRLERIDARIELPDKQWAKVEAPSGLYDGGRETLKLDAGLAVTTSTGYHIATSAADFDLASGRIDSRAPIRIEGPAGTIDAGRLAIDDNGRVLLFRDGVRMTFQPGAAAAPGGKVAETDARPAPR